MKRVCFDHLSGTPVAPEVMEAMRPWFTEYFGGTGAVHSGGVQARGALDDAREKAATFLGARYPEEIIFTSSGTESINLAIKGCALANQTRGRRIVVSAIEHPAVLESARALATLGFEIVRVGVSSVGKIDPGELAAALNDRTILVCVHAGHHDVGTIQDLVAIGNVVGERGIDLLVDATYAASWMPLDAEKIGASYIAVAPHRFNGPKGVGILYKRRRARLAPMIHGGAQELGWRAGTENIPAIVGAGAACALPRTIDAVAQIQRRLWEGLPACVQDIRINGAEVGAGRLPNSLNISLGGVEGEALALALDLKGFAITSGQACATKAEKLPPTLAAMGVPERFGAGTIILSFGGENTADEADRFLDVFPKVVAPARAMAESIS